MSPPDFLGSAFRMTHVLAFTTMEKKSFLLIMLLLTINWLTGRTQTTVLTGAAVKWNDSFSEWTIFTNEEGAEGELRLRWPLNNDWTEWQYRLGEASGIIKVKWNDNPNEWEVRGNGQVVTARTLWNNDFREWRISGGPTDVVLRVRYRNLIDEWEIRENKEAGFFEMYTAYERDPRDWVIRDDLTENISLTTKITMVFLVLFHSSPKE